MSMDHLKIIAGAVDSSAKRIRDGDTTGDAGRAYYYATLAWASLRIAAALEKIADAERSE